MAVALSFSGSASEGSTATMVRISQKSAHCQIPYEMSVELTFENWYYRTILPHTYELRVDTADGISQKSALYRNLQLEVAVEPTFGEFVLEGGTTVLVEFLKSQPTTKFTI